MPQKVCVDMKHDIVTGIDADGMPFEHELSSPQAFEILSAAWLRCGWDTKHVYSFTWLGRPIIQLPEDIVRLQELIYEVRPDVIVETGVAHGGSAVFFAGLCAAIGKGRVVAIDIEIRPHNRQAIETHELASKITLIQGDSKAPSVVREVESAVRPSETVFVVLDSCHSYEHTLAELRAYGKLVSVGSYMIAMDGIMGMVVGAPRTEADWDRNNPSVAVLDFLREDPRFELVRPKFAFNEGAVDTWITYAPGGVLKRIR